jgi:protein-S-isoprenylcysteine O-methyltransferase Ste14
MTCLVCGLASFLLISAADALRAFRPERGATRPVSVILSCAALGFLGLALWIGAAEAPRLGIHPALRIAALVASAPPLVLLILSEFVEVSFAPMDVSAPRLVESGSYALCRHPGFWWLLLFLAPAAVAAASLSLLISLPAWAAADLALVAAEDRIFFPRIFGPAYLDYRRRTPFLVPNAESMRRAARGRPKGTERP